MSESDESGEEQAGSDSGSDWGHNEKEAADEAGEDDEDDDDDVSMAGDDSDESPRNMSSSKKGASKQKRQKPSASKVCNMQCCSHPVGILPGATVGMLAASLEKIHNEAMMCAASGKHDVNMQCIHAMLKLAVNAFFLSRAL